jgi:hypothetical protein
MRTVDWDAGGGLFAPPYDDNDLSNGTAPEEQRIGAGSEELHAAVKYLETSVATMFPGAEVQTLLRQPTNVHVGTDKNAPCVIQTATFKPGTPDPVRQEFDACQLTYDGGEGLDSQDSDSGPEATLSAILRDVFGYSGAVPHFLNAVERELVANWPVGPKRMGTGGFYGVTDKYVASEWPEQSTCRDPRTSQMFTRVRLQDGDKYIDGWQSWF